MTEIAEIVPGVRRYRSVAAADAILARFAPDIDAGYTPNLYAYSLAFVNQEYNYSAAVSFALGAVVACGLIGLGHYTASGMSELAWWRHVHIWVDIACGVAVVACRMVISGAMVASWIAVDMALRSRRASNKSNDSLF